MVQYPHDDEAVIRGTVERVTFRNPSNGYSVLKVTIPDSREQITVVGSCPETRVGSHVLVRGTYRDHPKFGRQLTASSITETAPTTDAGLIKYLSSGLIKGVGEKTAEKIVAQFGAQTVETIFRDPDKLNHIPGVGKHKAQLISEAFAEQRDMREVMQFLIEHQISPRLSTKIYERYRNRAVEVLSRDPYLLARELRGVGFATADAIAMNLGLAPAAQERLQAGVYYALERASDDGHCFLTRAMLFQRARILLGLEEALDLGPALDALVKEEAIVREQHGSDEALFLRSIYRAEDFVARFIAERTDPRALQLIDRSMIQNALTAASQSLGIQFSPEQEHAVELATRYRLMIITGGPGCGKTTIIRALALLFQNAGKRLLLAAPTGRAAQRMAQVCALPASTIHRLLKYDPSTGGFQHGIHDPLIADAIIIDEASMIDVQLAKDLFSAVPHGAALILVGDKDQLPSVGPGRVFGDLISVREVKTVALSKLFRRAEASTINSIAHMINSGTVPDIPEPDGMTKADAYFIPKSDPEEAALTVEKLVADQLPRKFNINPTDICVLTPSNRGPLGTQALNKRLQDRINPRRAGLEEEQLEIHDTVLRLGDRVCQRVNNYTIDLVGVFNGDVGQIAAVSRKERSLSVEMWDGRLIRYHEGDLSQLSLAYAITVHRSQGSEIPCVVLVLHESHFTLLERQLIYTAVTRAKKLLVVVGSKKALTLASRRMTARKRMTYLKERVLTILRADDEPIIEPDYEQGRSE